MDLDTIRKLYSAEGPFVSIYLDSPIGVEGAADRYELKWKNLLRELEDLDVDAPTREAISAARGDHAEGGTRVIFASHGTVHLATSLPAPPSTDAVSVTTLPRVLPLLDRMSLQFPYVVVLIDRTGADVLGYAAFGRPVRSGEVQGPDQAHVHKTSVGGWSQQGNQQSTETEWQHNAEEVAAKVQGVVSDVGAEVLIAGGDERAFGYFRDALPQRLRDMLVQIDASRARDGGDEHVADRVLDAVAGVVRDRTMQLLERFAQERGQQDQACEGLPGTLAALRQAQVGTLILTEELDREQLVWVGADPTVVAMSREDVSALGVEDPREAELGDVLPWAALGTGADLRVVSGSFEQAPREGVGALLRYSQ